MCPVICDLLRWIIHVSKVLYDIYIYSEYSIVSICLKENSNFFKKKINISCVLRHPKGKNKT